MRFYTKQHKYYCGIDLHTKKCNFASLIVLAKYACTKILKPCETINPFIRPFRFLNLFPYNPRLLEPWISPELSYLDSELILYLLVFFNYCPRI